MQWSEVSFWILAAVATFSALGVVVFRNAVYSMLSLIVNLVSLAFVFSDAAITFYRHDSGARLRRGRHGAIPVRGHNAQPRQPACRRGGPFRRPVVCRHRPWGDPGRCIDLCRREWCGRAGFAVATTDRLSRAVAHYGSTQAFGLGLFHGFSLPFEVTSVLLVIAVLGAVVLGRRIMGRE